MRHPNVTYTFWPVGQGLFCTGKIRLKDNQEPFRWAYDCGTNSKKKYLTAAINEYQSRNKKPIINLVVVSHFDSDHINGLVELLSRFSVKTLLLPFIPLWQRLIIAFEEGIDTQQTLMSFFVNPVSYLSSIPGVEIDEILFVPPGEGEGPNDNNQRETGPFTMPEEDSWKFEKEELNNISPDQKNELSELIETQGVQSSNKSIKTVEFSWKSLAVSKFWEFIPYNDAHVFEKYMASGTAEFKGKVEGLRNSILRSPSNTTLVELKNLYDKKFGKSGKKRNVISLFLYSGPLRNLQDGYFLVYKFTKINFPYRIFAGTNNKSTRLGTLYTGDGYLSTQLQFNSLQTYLGDTRIKRISCLQVMHHGSKGNWLKGIAEKFSPYISVFCSNPSDNRFNHPDGDVVRDFLNYTPVQVDTTFGLKIGIEVRFP